MHKRHQHLNIPIEIVRTLVAISETGSLSKAAERLGLSQPAISSQIRRLQSLVGGSLFVKGANGTTATDLGKLAVQQARKIIEANDQLLRLGGNSFGPPPLRLGLSTSLVETFLAQKMEPLADVFIQADQSASIGRGLINGHIDVACIFNNAQLDPEVEHMITHEYEEPVSWIRARNFVLSPGAPLPIITHPANDWIIPTLTKHELSYKIVFNTPDNYASFAAVKAGIGLTAVPTRTIPADLMVAKEYYLPELPPVRTLLCERPGLEPQRSSVLIKQLSDLFFENSNTFAGKDVKGRHLKRSGAVA
jgi:DNA-binding transcriptional LysR family regulator